MAVKIDIGEFEVLSSGNVIGNLNTPIIFTIDDLIFEFHFTDTKDNPEQKATVKEHTEKKIVLEFLNFNNSLGTGNKTPIKVGDINSRELHLNFRIYALGDDAGKLFHYTWLLKSKEGGNNG